MKRIYLTNARAPELVQKRRGKETHVTHHTLVFCRRTQPKAQKLVLGQLPCARFLPSFSSSAAATAARARFFIFLFFIFVFYKNIFSIYKFTGIYPAAPLPDLAARQRGGRGISGKKNRGENCAQVLGGRSPGSGAAGPQAAR